MSLCKKLVLIATLSLFCIFALRVLILWLRSRRKKDPPVNEVTVEIKAPAAAGSKNLISSRINVTSGDLRKPVFLIPGLGGSGLEDTVSRPPGYRNSIKPEYDMFCVAQQRSRETLWVNLQAAMIGPPKFCWMDRIKTIWNMATKKLTNTPGVKSYTNGGIIDGKYKGCAGIRYLSYMPILGGMPTSDYFNTIITTLTAIGYTDGVNLFGLPYDFRLILDADVQAQYFHDLKLKIEQVRLATGQSVVLVGHSLGCVLTNLFLSYQSPEWKSHCIDCFVSIAGPYGGSPKALRTVVAGETEGIPLENVRDMQLIEQNFSGILWMLPMPEVFDGTAPLTADGVTASRIPELLRSLKMPSVEDEYRHLVTAELRRRSLADPGVLVHTICGTGLQTENSGYLFYPKQDIYGDYATQNGKIVYGNGDGTVTEAALSYPEKHWKNVVSYTVARGEHKAILNTTRCVQRLVDILTRETVSFLCEDVCPACNFGFTGCGWHSKPGAQCAANCKCHYDYRSLTCAKTLKT